MAKSVPLYQVDSFTSEIFRGNPAAVCVLDAWPSEEVMQKMAAENNLSETAYVVPDATGQADFALRWLTPEMEVDLCGHATLATAWVLFYERAFAKDQVTFSTRSGVLTVARGEYGLLTMDFPQTPAMPAPHPEDLPRALGRPALEYWKARNGMHVALLGSADQVRTLMPNLRSVRDMGGHGLIVTAQGDGADGDVDFVSRFFIPQAGIGEDPVTGSAHTVLAPYWAKRLKKDVLQARQVSQRGGDMTCEIAGARVKLTGRAVLFMKGEARLP